MHKTGNIVLDSLFGYVSGLNLIYGAPATGKTTLCLEAASNYAENGKVIFIDTENSFSVERIKQINPNVKLDNVFLIKIKHFEEQLNVVKNLIKLKGQISIIIVDSVSAYYRKCLQDKQNVNPLFANHLSLLKEFSETGIPILLSAQVYSTMEGDIEVVGKTMIRNWSNIIIQLSNNEKRLLKLEKHPEKGKLIIPFTIKEEGLVF